MPGAENGFSIAQAREWVAGVWRGFDKAILLSSLLLVAYGLLVVYSASLTIDEANVSRQFAGVLIGLIAGACISMFDYRHLSTFVTILMVVDCALMIAPLVPGLSYSAKGITGWIKVPIIGLTFQTSELAKPVTIVLMAALGAQYKGRVDQLRDYIRMCAYLAVPFLLIMLQPDLGTGLVVLFAGALVIVFSGPRVKWVLVTLAIIVGAVTLILVTDPIIDAKFGDASSLLKDYQMNRLLVFLNPEADTTSAGYNLQQALIAVGSGGLFGKGIGNATQAGSGFLPEAHTDFVFALQAEEFGFVGSMIVIGLYLCLCIFSLKLAARCQEHFGQLVVVGIVAMWMFQIFENIGMCLSLMPITGIPLPFISYGGSSMIVQLMTVGLLQSVSLHEGRSA